MNERIETDKPIIDPVYSQEEPNQPIDLGQVAVQIEHNGTPCRRTASATMTFYPETHLTFVISPDADSQCSGFVNAGTKLQITLPQRNVTVDCFCGRLGEKYGGMVLSPTRSGVTVTQPSSNISKAVFHLFNFPDFFSPEDYVLRTDEHTEIRGGRVTLKADGWVITIAATGRTNELEERLEAHGGYVITHMGQIVREDGAVFNSDQLDDLLTCLHHFLSFTLGCWAGLALPVGFDNDGNRVFEQWGIRRVANGPWNAIGSWFDRHHGDFLSQVFPGFLSRWQDATWRQTLASAVYWYLEACDHSIGVGVDTGVILAQTALELLSWTYCVRDRALLLPETFEKPGALKASDKLRMLISNLGIPREIPSILSRLCNPSEGKWHDSLHAMTDIRNSIVHPDKKARVTDDLYYQAYQLSVWYLDLVLLHLCGHGGHYANRLNASTRWEGEVELVPWSLEQGHV